ncbi:MAG: hypothetical protein HY782_20700 [Chloroflexi bacterium]|nr:hypothetical protein [Chloroflexota bacterium]
MTDQSPTFPDYFEKVAGSASFDRDGAFKFIGVRAFVMSAATIADLMDDFYLVLGQRFVDARLYMGGRRAGVRTAAALVAAQKLDPRDKPNIERLFADFYAALGWAKLDFHLDYANKTGHVIAQNSFLAQGALAKFTAQGKATSVANVTAPFARCVMLGGYIAGLTSNLLESDVDMRETECLTLEYPGCRFEVTPERLYTVKRET